MLKHLYLTHAVVLLVISSFAQFKPGQTFRDCADCPEMVVIPAGSFTMGTPASEVEKDPFGETRLQLEGSQRVVNVQQFAVGKFDITRGQWAAFVSATKRPTSMGCHWSFLPAAPGSKPWESNPEANWKNLGFLQDDNHPVVCVTWNDAQDYVQWLSRKTGGDYRLLSEAEWEYAARAGTSTAYPWGSVASHDYANYGTDTVAGVGLASGRDAWVATSPVGSFPPNQFGLYDMHGNAMQWVEDCFSPTYAGLPTDGSPYKTSIALKDQPERFAWMNGENSCSYRLCRGGDAWNPPVMIRSASRNFAPGRGATLENYRSAGLTFRVAKNLP
ncbi:MAG: formylglycine-generating enzyme family protein [Chitinophagaceae bacterium]|nr:formylglycine-generating enzyme family protein [Chitinophagaceae bacterium]